MIRVSSSRSVLILCVLLLLAAVPVYAQSGNLLTNPGFEPPFATLDGAPPREVAEGWTPWHVPAAPEMSSSENVQPEYYPASDTTNGLGVPRIRNGSNAQQYFSFFATHVGGVYQTVSGITPGDTVRFSVYAYLWSSTFDDPDLSEQDGGLTLQVGIDPTGGTNGESADIIWSIAAQTYDTYTEYSVSAPAAADSVTVFIRSSVSFPVKNNVVYLDDAALVVESSGGEPTATVEPTIEVPTATTEAATEVPTVEPTVEAPTATTESVIPTAEGTVEVTVEVPTATTEAPTVEPTVEPPTATTEPPTAEPPTPTIEPPTATTEPPTAEPPTATPELPTAEPPTATPVTPTEIPATATNTNTPAPSPTLNRTQFPLQIIYLVSEGDTVGAIAARYGTTVEAIIIANGLNANALIFAGQQLIIPVSNIPTATFTPSITPTGATAVPATATATLTNTPQYTGPMILYIVQSGDTLSGIAQRFGTTVTAIAQANNILNLQLVFVGQRLNIPSRGVTAPLPTRTPTRVAATATRTNTPTATATIQPVTGGIQYRVQYGDNLYSIAVRFGVTVNSLVQVNNITTPSRIFVGQVITIP